MLRGFPAALLGAWLSRHKEDHDAELANSNHAKDGSARLRSSVENATQQREFSHDGSYDQFVLFSGHSQNLITWTPSAIRVFETNSRDLGSIVGSRFPLCFSSDNKSFVTTGNGLIEQWRLADLSLSKSISEISPETVSSDGTWKVACHGQGTLVLGVTTGIVAPLELNDSGMFNPYGMAYSDRLGILLSAAGDCVVIADSISREVLWRSPSVGRDVTSVAISTDDKVAVYGSMGGSLCVLDLVQREVVGRLMIPGEIRCVSFAPDGRHVAVGCGDLLSDVIVLNVTTGPHRIVKIGYPNNWSVAFSPDGETLAVGSDNGKLSLWNWQ